MGMCPSQNIFTVIENSKNSSKISKMHRPKISKIIEMKMKTNRKPEGIISIPLSTWDTENSRHWILIQSLRSQRLTLSRHSTCSLEVSSKCMGKVCQRGLPPPSKTLTPLSHSCLWTNSATGCWECRRIRSFKSARPSRPSKRRATRS